MRGLLACGIYYPEREVEESDCSCWEERDIINEPEEKNKFSR